MAGENSHQKRSTRQGRRARLVAESCLWLLAVAVPLALGGVHPPVFAAALVVAAIALAAVGFRRRAETVSVPLAAAALGLGTLFSLVTVLPLPAALVGLLSPRARAFASLPPEPVPSWMPLSLDPPSTWVDLMRLGALFAVVLVAAHASQREPIERRLAMAVTVGGLGTLLVGAVHAIAEMPALYGVFHRSGGLLPTPFVNPNHAASLLTLSCCAAIGLARNVSDPLPRFGWIAAAVACGIGTLLTLSVAGVGALVLGVGLVVLLAAVRPQGERPPARGSIAAVAVAGLVALSLALSLGAGSVFEELQGLDQHAVSKTAAWPGALQLVREHLWTGVGRGAFSSAFAAYTPARSQSTFTHPENLLLQWTAEWGVPAALLGLAALAVTLVVALRARSRTNHAQSALQEAVWAGCVAVLAHDLFDFGLEFAGVGLPFAIALGLLAGQATRGRGLRVAAVPGWALVGCAAGLLALAGFGLSLGARHQVDVELDQLAQLDGKSDAETLDRAYRAVRARHPADALVAMRAGAALLARAEGPKEMGDRGLALAKALPHLARAQELSTGDQPHVLAARALARLGRHAQAMSELRRAFIVGTNTWGVAREALRLGANGEELASLPIAYAHALQEAGEPVTDAAQAGASALRYVGLDLGQRRVAYEAMRALLGPDGDPALAQTNPIPAAACQVTQADTDGAAQKLAHASPPESVPEHAQFLLDVSRRLSQPGGEPAGGVWCAQLAYHWLGDEARALQVLEEGVEKLPADSGLRVALAEKRLQAGLPDAALKLVESLPEDTSDPRLPDVHRLRIEALWRQGRTTRALSEAEDTARLHPTASWAHVQLAQVLERDGQLVAALNALSSARRFASETELPRLESWRTRLEVDVAARAQRPAVRAETGTAP